MFENTSYEIAYKSDGTTWEEYETLDDCKKVLPELQRIYPKEEFMIVEVKRTEITNK